MTPPQIISITPGAITLAHLRKVVRDGAIVTLGDDARAAVHGRSGEHRGVAVDDGLA